MRISIPSHKVLDFKHELDQEQIKGIDILIQSAKDKKLNSVTLNWKHCKQVSQIYYKDKGYKVECDAFNCFGTVGNMFITISW